MPKQTHLPHFLTKRAVYKVMIEEMKDQGLDDTFHISESHFYATWEKNFKSVIIPKVKIVWYTIVHYTGYVIMILCIL